MPPPLLAPPNERVLPPLPLPNEPLFTLREGELLLPNVRVPVPLLLLLLLPFENERTLRELLPELELRSDELPNVRTPEPLLLRALLLPDPFESKVLTPVP